MVLVSPLVWQPIGADAFIFTRKTRMINSDTGALRCAQRTVGAVVLGCLLMGSMAHAGCNANVPRTRPDSRYALVALATPVGSEVRDNVTGLVWQRCMFGMVWNGATCTGTASRLAWKDALEAARTATMSTAASATAWRVPNYGELSSLVELACFSPAINPTWFPATPFDLVFTSSPNVATFEGDTVWMIDSEVGSIFGYLRDRLGSVRLVRLVRSGP
jgi:hypothetical protein